MYIHILDMDSLFRANPVDDGAVVPKVLVKIKGYFNTTYVVPPLDALAEVLAGRNSVRLPRKAALQTFKIGFETTSERYRISAKYDI